MSIAGKTSADIIYKPKSVYFGSLSLLMDNPISILVSSNISHKENISLVY